MLCWVVDSVDWKENKRVVATGIDAAGGKVVLLGFVKVAE